MSIEHSKPSTRFRFPFQRKSSYPPTSGPSSKKSRKKLLVYAAIALVISAASLSSMLMPLEGKLLTVHPQEFTKGFTEEALVHPEKEWPLYNEMNGKIASLAVRNGESVKKGQLLLSLETKDLEYQLRSLKSQLTSLEGQRLQNYRSPYTSLIKQQSLAVNQAESDYLAQEQNLSRMKTLYEAGAVSLTQYEEAQHLAEKAKNSFEQQKSALALLYEQHTPAPGTELVYSGQKEALNTQIAQLEEKLLKSKIIAPNDGFIKDLTLKEGEFSSQGQLLLSVYQDQGYRLESYVLASDALALKSGQNVDVIQEGSNGKNTFTGKIDSLDPSAVERISPLGLKENRVKVTLSLSSNSPVIIGSHVDVKFTTQKEANQIMVPKTALFPYQNGKAVWVVRDGKAHIQPILQGMDNDREIIIKEGITDGDQILLDIELKGLKEGKRVKP